MYVKSLTLRGFKSFASATAMRFEPGITCVVGPNGSGKSNIVDAFAWVMGEQGAKTLRGGKMDDVVFAGTASRPPLGRAEVTLTIDNSDGALPIDYTEVTISRLMFRSGGSEYAINGNHCRLLDVAELLSDSGLGREMHVIVGQGQLDEVLHAGPDARRALIEEAAGVLKHRRRKEKALRKLDAMQANLTRLEDLTTEVRRRLGPLSRQAAIARRAVAIQADLRDAKLRLLADDYATGAAELERGEADEAVVLARRSELEQLLTQARQRENALDADEAEHAPRLARAQDAWFSLSALAERLRGVSNLARERHSHLVAEPPAARPGRDPEDLEQEADALREQEAVLGERLETARSRLTAANGHRVAAEAKLAGAEKHLAAQARAAADRAERLARLRAQVGAARSRVAAAQEESERLAGAFEQARSRATAAQRELEEYQDLAAGRQDDRAGLAAVHEEAAARLTESSARAAECRAAERRASADRAGLLARTQALEEGIRALGQGSDATAGLLSDPRWSGEVLGAVAGQLTVAEGAQEAVTAALGGAADAIAVASLDAAVTILQQLKDSGSGSTGLVIAAVGARGGTGGSGGTGGERAAGSEGTGGAAGGDGAWDAAGGGHAPGADGAERPGGGDGPARVVSAAGGLPPGATPALDLVTAPGTLAAALAGLLADVVVTDGLARAQEVVRAHPRLRVVTRDGDLVGAHWAQGGSARPPSVLAMRAAAEEAAAGLGAAERACEEAAGALSRAVTEEEQSRRAVSAALAALQAADKAAADVSGQLGRLAGAARAAQEEAARLEAAIAAARKQRERDEAALAELGTRLAQAEGGVPSGEPSGGGAGQAGADAAAVDAGGPDGAGAESGGVHGGGAHGGGVHGAGADGGGAGGAGRGQAEGERAGVPGWGPAGDDEAEASRELLAQADSAAREAEMEARLEVRTAEERLRAIAGRADQLAAAAVSERRAAQAALARRRLRAQQAAVAGAVAKGAALTLERLTESLGIAAAEREAAQVASKGRAQALKEVRGQVRSVTAELDKVVDSAHGAEIARSEHRMRLEQIAARAADEFAVDVATLIAEYGPDVPVPVTDPDDQPGSKSRRGTRAGRAGRGRAAEPSPAVLSPAEPSPAGPSHAGPSPAGQGAPAPAGNGAWAGDGVPAYAPTRDGENGRAAGWPGAGNGRAAPGHSGNGVAGAPRVAQDASGGAARENGNATVAHGSTDGGAGGPAAGQHESTGQHESMTATHAAPAGPHAGTAGPRATPTGPPETPTGPSETTGPPETTGRQDGTGRDGADGTAPTRFIPYVRAEQERRAAAAQRQLDQLGKVNPLALEEFAALEERHAFLATQLEDLKKTRRDLLTVVKEVDDRVQQVFASAFADTATEFEQVFSRLFPGGEGRLVLTEPGDMLTTGIDVEARPPGKKVKRLSLLSGGERSLTAIAYLVAIFKARPSPFYVLDEVEAALDDTNLQRLLVVFEELRSISQLIIITHQKRTMEVADALYGISMRGDGVSAVVSQRLRERERA